MPSSDALTEARALLAHFDEIAHDTQMARDRVAGLVADLEQAEGDTAAQQRRRGFLIVRDSGVGIVSGLAAVRWLRKRAMVVTVAAATAAAGGAVIEQLDEPPPRPPLVQPGPRRLPMRTKPPIPTPPIPNPMASGSRPDGPSGGPAEMVTAPGEAPPSGTEPGPEPDPPPSTTPPDPPPSEPPSNGRVDECRLRINLPALLPGELGDRLYEGILCPNGGN